MKKNISINISGIIFHIEEDGYEKLKDYLETIHKYFSTYDDSTEITADIENRIAEIFLSKLKEGKQVITLEDVEALIATMGGIKDFKEVEMEEEEPEAAKAGPQPGTGPKVAEPSRKLYRDEKHKILGGVIAGIAHHFSIDPLWVRLAFIIMFFGVWIFPAFPAILTLTYIVLWIVIPGSYEIADDRKFKKMYRNPDHKVLGGVANGVSTYFGVDVVIIRLLFIILIFFGGTGLILYIILWIILPEATTITDKIEMQGEPVTLKNIESNIKKSLKVESNQEESIWTKILLFPFRLIASVIEFLSKVLGPFVNFLVEAVRVAFGLILVLFAVALILGLLVAGGLGIGLFSGNEWFIHSDVPINVILHGIPALPFIGAFFAGLIPAIFLVILGLSVITKQLLLNAKIGWGLFSLWVISLVIMAFTVPKLIIDFSREGDVVEVENYDLGSKTLVLKLHETGMEDYERVSLKLRGQDGPEVRLEKRYDARGNSREEAISNAKMIDYSIVQADSVLTFDSNIRFKEGANFRGQSLDMVLYIPYNKPFLMNEDLKYILRGTLYNYGFSTSDMQGNTWMFTTDGLKCVTCAVSPEKKNEESYDFDIHGYSKTYDMGNFKSINAGTIFKLNIYRSKDTRVIASGRENDIRHVNMHVDGDELVLDLDEHFPRWNQDLREITVNISVPELEHIRLGGASKASIKGFDEDNLEFDLSGAANVDADIHVRSLTVNVEGAAKISLNGDGDNLSGKVNGASTLNAFDYEVKSADLNVSGASTARVHASEALEAEATGFGKIRYRGDPRLNIHGSGLNNVSKED